MKRIEFISPVEAMRGNLSRTKQTLLYAENDNPAWDAPVDKRSYARNYQPIFVGAKVAKSGRKYFAIKTKTAITITAAAKTRMALLAASSEIANVISKDLRIFPALEELYAANHPVGWSYKRWQMYYIRQGLANKTAITFPGYEQLAAVFVKNPYISTTQPSSAIDISKFYPTELLVKFWMQLANNPYTFVIGDQIGLGHEGDTFDTIIAGNYNVLGLESDEVSGVEFVKQGEQWLQVRDTTDPTDDWHYVPVDNTPAHGVTIDIYRLTDETPDA